MLPIPNRVRQFKVNEGYLYIDRATPIQYLSYSISPDKRLSIATSEVLKVEVRVCVGEKCFFSEVSGLRFLSKAFHLWHSTT